MPATKSAPRSASKPAAQPASQPTTGDLLATIAELQQQLEQRDELNQILWLNDRFDFDRTKSGKRKIKFSAQKSTIKEDGTRAYGPYRNFVCYNEELIETINQILQSNDKLVRITAFESPWTDNSKRSDFVVTSISVIPRVNAEPDQGELQPQPAPFAGEPTDEEVPF